ncbi:unnamed protein product [Allacma fusca]|uniref:poly(ADP-ribose) glycohydrolase n=1 Tax=Allacma fusca TaxID=39272 RepID=A0A8J2KHS7_9HEXA|nr:unnamed protein product [Allacma fusca]
MFCTRLNYHLNVGRMTSPSGHEVPNQESSSLHQDMDAESRSSPSLCKQLIVEDRLDIQKSVTEVTSAVSVCNSVVIDIEEPEEEECERTVIPDSDSDNTDFEENRTEGKVDGNVDLNEEDANEPVEETRTDQGRPVSPLSENDTDDSDGFPPVISASQAELKEMQDRMMVVEERNKDILGNLKRFTPSDRIFPDVRSSNFHTVAVTLTDDFKPGDALAPYPISFTPKWHKDYVPLPCCDENIRTFRKRVVDENTGGEQGEPTFTDIKVLMWERIQSALARPLETCEDIASAMKTYCKFNGSLIVLEYTLATLMSPEERTLFFSKTLPGMVTLCLDLRKIITCGLPFLCRFMNYSLTLSQKQIACLLANAFFSTFPARFTYEDDFPSINFIGLLTGNGDDSRISSMGHKLRCILHYFERVIEEMPKGVVTYTRKSVRSSKSPDWSLSGKELTQLITLHEGSIETEGERLLQIDFANKYVGGGVLGHGCVQEEILFVIYPELLVSRLFTERLVSCEALVITGCERFSKYKGYASNFEFAGDFVDCVPWNSRARKCTQIVAIDAQYVVRHTDQFHPRKLLREVNKAFIGFSISPGSSNNVAVATGKWGCGAFKGDAHLKTILQLLAASQASRHLVLFTFGDLFLQKEVEEMYEKIKHMKIKEVWALLEQYNKLFCSRQKPSLNLHEFFTEYIQISNYSDKESMETDNDSTLLVKELAINAAMKSTSSVAFQSQKNVQKSASQTSGSSDWLGKLDNTKAQWKTYKPENSMDDFNFNGKQTLDQDQISALLDEPESMDFETEETSKKEQASLSDPCNQLAATADPKQDLKDGVEVKSSPLFSKRAKPGVHEAEVGDTGLKLSTGVPKQKRQMTLKDFYKPI